MPDRYGENEQNPGYPQDDPGSPDPDIARITDPYVTANCDLCDDNGYRGGTVCDHIDHQAAAKRGMDMIRQAMGWTS